jgi:glycosyltransferase involved in cell wall biosynthesis
MRVVFATHNAHLPQAVGGSEQSTHDLVPALTRAGHDVAVLASLVPGGYVGYRTRLLDRWHKLLRRERMACDQLMGYSVFRAWDPTRAVPQFTKQFRPDLALIQSGRLMELAARFIAQAIPTIVYVRSAEFWAMGGAPAPNRLLRFIANSEFIAAQANAALGIESIVIPPLVQRERFATETTREKLVFINPVPEKGVDIAVALAKRRQDVPFLFVEAWPLSKARRAAVLASVANLPNVTWLPPQLDMRRVYGQARALLVPSRWLEAWGRVVSEAQISGIPVLASRRGGLPEAVGPGGILVDPEAPIDAWEDALGQLWDDPRTYTRLSRLARDHAQRASFQPAALADRLLAVISEHANLGGATSSTVRHIADRVSVAR